MHHNDFLIGQFGTRIVLRDARVVPVGDFAQENVGQHVTAEANVGDAGNAVNRNYSSEHSWDMNQLDLGGGNHVIGHRHVGCSEVDQAAGDLANAAARTDGLVVDFHARMRRAILAEPL